MDIEGGRDIGSGEHGRQGGDVGGSTEQITLDTTSPSKVTKTGLGPVTTEPSQFHASIPGEQGTHATGGPKPGDTGSGAASEAGHDRGEVSDGPADRASESGDQPGEQAPERTERGNEHGEGGGYDREGAERDRERLNKRLDELSETLAELRGNSDDLDSRVAEIQRDIADLKAMVDDLAGSGGGQSPGAAFQPVAQLSVIEDDALAAAEDDDRAPHGFLERLRRMFRGIWRLLWRLLSRFRMVKEWSLSGELGPVPFMGKVGVSVTFGR